MTPILNRLRVRKYEEKQDGIIIIPHSIKKDNIAHEVISAGPKVKLAKPGDIVWTFPSVETDMGDGTSIIQEHDIRAVFTPSDADRLLRTEGDKSGAVVGQEKSAD